MTTDPARLAELVEQLERYETGAEAYVPPGFFAEAAQALRVAGERIAELAPELKMYRAVYKDHGEQTIGGMMARAKERDEYKGRAEAAERERDELRKVKSCALAFLAHFNPHKLPSDAEQQYFALHDQIERAALTQKDKPDG